MKLAEKSDGLVVATKRLITVGQRGHEDEKHETRTTELDVRRKPARNGDKGRPDLWASPASRLPKVRVKEFERFVTGTTDASQLMEAAASESNLWVSLYKVVQNKGAPGVDGVSVKQF